MEKPKGKPQKAAAPSGGRQSQIFAAAQNIFAKHNAKCWAEFPGPFIVGLFTFKLLGDLADE